MLRHPSGFLARGEESSRLACALRLWGTEETEGKAEMTGTEENWGRAGTSEMGGTEETQSLETEAEKAAWEESEVSVC